MTSAHTFTRKLNINTSLHTPRTALIAAGVVLFLSLLSFYVDLLQSQVKRGETFREAQRARLYAVGDSSALRTARAPESQNNPLAASASPR